MTSRRTLRSQKLWIEDDLVVQWQGRGVRESPGSAGEVSGSTITRALRLTLWAALFWTGLAIFFASQIVFITRGRVPWGTAFSFSAPRWYVWGLLTPLVFWIDRRLGAGRTLKSRVALHIPLGVAMTLLSVVL